MTDRLLDRLCAIGIGIAPDFPAGEVLVDWELVLEAIRRIEEQEAEIERLRSLIGYWHIGYGRDFGHSQVVQLRDERQIMDEQEAEIELLREALSRWEAVVNSVTQGHNKLGLNGYDIVDAELRVLRHGRELDADEIERLRGLVDWLASEVAGSFVDHPTYGPVLIYTDSWGDQAYEYENPVPEHVAELLRATKAKHQAAEQANIEARLAGMRAAYDIDRLRRLVVEFGRHQDECEANYSGLYCDCGWDGAVASLPDEEAQP